MDTGKGGSRETHRQNIKGLPAPERGNRIAYDDGVAGFGLRVTAAGVKSFVLNY